MLRFCSTGRWPGLAVGAMILSLAAPGALAAAQRSFVASTGLDGNPCSLTQPCRSFAVAMAQTLPGGEVVILDSAGYGPLTIDKSVSIIAPPGVYAGISVTSGTGVTITGTGLTVLLRGLSVTGVGGSTGIYVGATDSEVHIDDVTVSGMNGTGINVSAGAGTRVYVAGATVRSNALQGVYISGGSRVLMDRARIEENDNGGISLYDAGEAWLRDSVVHRNSTGINAIIFSGPGPQRLVVERTTISGSVYGGINVQIQSATGQIEAVVRDSTIIGNAGGGYSGINFQCFSTGAGGLTMTGTVISDHNTSNASGLQVAGLPCKAALGGNTFTRNVTGLAVDPGTTTTFGNNQFDRNGTDVSGMPTLKVPR